MQRPETKHMAIGKRLLTHLPQGLVIGCMILVMVVGGNMSVALASEAQHLFHIHHQTVTGTLEHIPLKAVLEDLKEQLGLEYSGPEKEMQTLVSGQFQAESLSAALSSILAAWDYVLIFDPTGKPIKIFLASKRADETIQAREQPQTRYARQKHSGHSPRPEKDSSRFPELSANHKNHQQKIKASSMPVEPRDTFPHMTLQPSAGKEIVITPTASSSARMPILPPGKMMTLIPTTSLTGRMPIIPTSGFPPMEIFPVSPKTARDFVETIQ